MYHWVELKEFFACTGFVFVFGMALGLLIMRADDTTNRNNSYMTVAQELLLAKDTR
jgi:hypothetical protein